MNLPNALTFLRILMIPLIVVVFYQPTPWAAWGSAVIFALAGLTDLLDGYLARKLGQESRFGAFLDPVADKLMVVSVLLMLIERESSLWITLPALVIVGREITISALREWMAEIGQRGKVAVSFIGKIKTSTQMAALFFLLIQEPWFGIPFHEIGLGLLLIAVFFTLWSMVVYLRAAFAR